MCVAAAIVGSAAVGAIATTSAADTQADAANNAANAAREQNAQQRADMAPWRAAGQSALNQISDLGGYFNHQFNAQDLKSNLAPNYDFQLQQGLGAVTNAANAGGFGGNALKGINDYAQNYAANAYQQAFSNYTANQSNIYNRLSNLAGLGQTANQVTGALGAQNTQNAGNFLTSGANATAAGYVGAANVANNATNQYMAWNYLNKSPPAPDAGNAAWSGFGGTAADPWYG